MPGKTASAAALRGLDDIASGLQIRTNVENGAGNSSHPHDQLRAAPSVTSTPLDHELLTVHDAARFLNVTISMGVRAHAPNAEDRLPFVKLGKYIRFDRTDLRAYVDRKRHAAGQPDRQTLTTDSDRATVSHRRQDEPLRERRHQWLEDGIKQVVCSSEESAARSGWHGGGRMCCWKADSSVGCIVRWFSALVAELPTKRHALTKLEEQIRPVNQGTTRPEASMRFGVFAESQWSVARAADAEALDPARLQERTQQARAPLLAGMAAAGHRQARCAAVRRRQVPPAGSDGRRSATRGRCSPASSRRRSSTATSR